MSVRFKSVLAALALAALVCGSLCLGQASPQGPAPDPASEAQPDQRGIIRGTVVDATGAVVAGAHVSLKRQDHASDQEAISDADGQFSLTNVPAGAFELMTTAAGFASQTSSGTLRSGEIQTVPAIALAIASTETDVQVVLSAPEIAEGQVKDEEKQRVLGVIPNFYVTYDPHPVALNSRQKFELAWKMAIDPVTFVITGAIAGAQQANNTFPGYGQGAGGYAKRYGASYADFISGTFLGSAIFPSLLKQDPRYFYKGTGTDGARIRYALANALICKGDNGRWKPNYSNILGNLAAGGISNLYYPADDRNGARLTFQNAAIGIAATGAANIFQEFVVRKLSRNQNQTTTTP